MTNPFIREHITITMDPHSGTNEYDSFKYGVQDYLNGVEALESVNDVALSFIPQMFRPYFVPPKILSAYHKGILSSANNHSLPTANVMLDKARETGSDSEVNELLNFGFFTHNLSNDAQRNLSLNQINPDAIIEQFARHDPTKWPNLLLNCNHARVATSQSVSGIMEGFHRLASDCFSDGKGKPRELKLIMNHDDRPDQNDDDSGKATIMLSAVFNHWNAFGNSGTLIHRIHQLDDVYEKEAAGGYASQRAREKAMIGTGFGCMSPASIMLAKLMLKLIAKDPSQITIPAREEFEEIGSYDDGKIYKSNRLSELLTNSDQPIKLREDAEQILQHILPQGYSKGGNIMTDAVRFLLLDLVRLQELSHGTAAHEIDVKGLMFNLGILAINPAETPLTAYEEKMGMRRLMIASTRDGIIDHFISRPIMKALKTPLAGGRQGYYEVTPKAKLESLGHDYFDALGRSGRHGEGEASGYVADPKKLVTTTAEMKKTAHEVRSRLRVIHAACYNALGISDVHEREDGRFEIEFSRGADSARIQKIANALAAKLNPESQKATCDVQTGVCSVSFLDDDKPATSHLPPITHQAALEKALKELADPNRMVNGTPELFVGDHIYEKLSAHTKGRA